MNYFKLLSIFNTMIENLSELFDNKQRKINKKINRFLKNNKKIYQKGFAAEKISEVANFPLFKSKHKQNETIYEQIKSMLKFDIKNIHN